MHRTEEVWYDKADLLVTDSPKSANLLLQASLVCMQSL